MGEIAMKRTTRRLPMPAITDRMLEPPVWSRPIATLLADFHAQPSGLSGQEAAKRLLRDGPNRVQKEAGSTAAALLFRQFQSPLVLILVFAALIAGSLRQWLEATIILAIVLGSTLLGFIQEYRASTAVAQLRDRLALAARVRRDGQVMATPFDNLVVGDIVLLSAGAVVPADAVVLQAQDLLVSEAPLTGESFPVEKRPAVLPPAAGLAARTNMVFLGTSVRSGTAEVLVVQTGRHTEFGAIAERLKAKPPETDYARGVRRFGAMLIRIMVLVVIFVLTMNHLLGRPFLDSLLFAVALGVGLSPELLPAIISVTLSAGAQRLAKSGVIVRRLEAIENLGSMTIFCTDKTGTLTEGRIRLEEAVDPNGLPSPAVGRLAFLNAAFETGIENPLDEAIVAWGRENRQVTDGHIKVDEIPYDFTRKRLTIVVQEPDGGDHRLMITKGAFAEVIASCATWRAPDGEAPLDAAARTRVTAYFQKRGEEGFRVLALATRRMDVRPDYVIADEAEMCLTGLLVFMDPPKPEAATAIRDLAALGVEVKVISGDNRHVVAYVANALGLGDRRLITGDQLAKIKDEALWNVAAQTTLFAEVDPQAKERIIRALQRTGHSVGYLGDGINDAPALYAADVGISVEKAVDVARESADVVLLSRDLDVLRQGVIGGRRTFANTLKYICITISANFGNMVSMAIAAPLLPFLPMTAAQILLNNFLSDLPAVTLSSDSVDDSQVSHAQGLSIGDIQRFMIVFGLISSAFDLLTFGLLFWVFKAGAATFQTAWFVISLLTELAVLLVLRTQQPAWRSRPARLLVWSTVAVAALALAAPYLGSVSSLFGLAPLPPTLLAALVLTLAGYAVVTELAKQRFFRHVRLRNDAAKTRP
ncbi:MAG: magnesium-translocating P-type ATPase [Caulobacteraceae bacterium]